MKDVNRTQLLPLLFLIAAWLSLVAILALAPDVYDQAMRLNGGNAQLAVLGLLAGISLLIVIVATGVVRKWRWTFWLLLVAFLAGVLRVPAAALELTGVLLQSAPVWYEVFTAVIGVVQFGIGLVMLAD